MERISPARLISLALALLVMLAACTPADVPTTSRPTAINQPSVTGGTSGGSNSNHVSAETPPVVEILNLVEPNISTDDYPTYSSGVGVPGAGTYVTKLTLPQNYSGYLYIGGINIGTLKSRFNKVRFTFGASNTVVEIPATITTAPGITPNTDIDVMVLDLRSRPFQSLRLLYDLYDYRDYSDPTTLPVETNRDPNLYCRALNLVDDHTFNGQGACDGLAADGVTALSEKCLYTYAKVVDRGLTKVSGATETALSPTVPQTDLTSTQAGYYDQTTANLLNRCLPDQALGTATVVSGTSGTTGVQDLSFTTFAQAGVLQQLDASSAVVYSQDVKYYGPFKPINAANWGIQGDAVFGTYGLFEFTPAWPAAATFADKMDLMALHHSKLFPRFLAMTLRDGVRYLKTDITNTDLKTVTQMVGNGKSESMDGCSTRALSMNTSGYHVGSCNASAAIEVWSKDDNGVWFQVASTNRVVLQLVRAAQIQTDGSDYMYTSFKTCQNGSQCGSDECCYNKRCWSSSLIAQCLENATTIGNQPLGTTCSSDYQCGSLCCNRDSGTCAVHDNHLSPAVLCGHSVGQSCIAKEWCQKLTRNYCYPIKDPPDPVTGAAKCHKQCFTREVFADCDRGVCKEPAEGDQMTTWDPANPDCTNAIDPPDFSGD